MLEASRHIACSSPFDLEYSILSRKFFVTSRICSKKIGLASHWSLYRCYTNRWTRGEVKIWSHHLRWEVMSIGFCDWPCWFSVDLCSWNSYPRQRKISYFCRKAPSFCLHLSSLFFEPISIPLSTLKPQWSSPSPTNLQLTSLLLRIYFHSF